MAILSITAQRTSFPQIGILRKGAKKVQDNKPGQDLTFFRFVSEDVDANRLFLEAYGAEPRSVNILLPFSTTDENIEEWMEHWGAGSLKHRCDGATCVIWQDDAGAYHTDPIPCPSLAAGLQGKAGGCRPTVRLQVIIPELKRLAQITVLSTSWNDAVELDANLRAAETAARMMGIDLRGIPFTLTRVEREISTPPRRRDDGTMTQRVRARKWLLHVEAAPSWVALQIEAARQMATPQLASGQPHLIEPPSDDDDDVALLGEIVDPTGDEDDHDEPAPPRSSRGRGPAPVDTGATPPPPAPAAATNGNGDRRSKFLARLQELAQESANLGQPVTIDRTWLQEATIEQLTMTGQALRTQVDQLKAQP